VWGRHTGAGRWIAHACLRGWAARLLAGGFLDMGQGCRGPAGRCAEWHVGRWAGIHILLPTCKLPPQSEALYSPLERVAAAPDLPRWQHLAATCCQDRGLVHGSELSHEGVGGLCLCLWWIRAALQHLGWGPGALKPPSSGWKQRHWKYASPACAEIERRLSEWTMIPVENGEGIQVLRYQNGQEYKPHFGTSPIS
jgi:hypothetical protein